MRWNKHSRVEGQHAFLSPSQYHWIRYDLEKLGRVFDNRMRARLGDRKHAFAKEAIILKEKMAGSGTLAKYIEDAIDLNMSPEVTLYYSEFSFGTADCISFRNNKLRIHDLKTGTNATSMDQLMVYAALFCLEYKVAPSEIEIELRIYQSNTIKVYEPDLTEIVQIMDHIITCDKYLKARMEEAWL